MSRITKRNDAIAKAQEILDNCDRYIIVDTETSGLGDRAEVLEICAMSLQGEVLLEYFFMPTDIIAPEAIATHGLTKEILQQKGAMTWASCASQISKAFAGRIMLAYNASFDQKMIAQTAALYGFESPIAETFCIMRLRQQFEGAANSQPLEGDHTAQGDCRQTLSILQEIAAAEILEDPEAFEITNNDELIDICLELKEIAAQRLALAKREEIIKAKCGLYLKEMELEQVSLKNGYQVERLDSIANVKPKIPIVDLAAKFKTTRVNHNAVRKLWQEGKLDDQLFSYEETWSIKIKKQ
ncbi:MAG: 3'-5' exonuclease [Cyanobacteria bacterium P01_G01_bin.39]